MVIKRSYRKTPYMPIQEHWMAILPFTPQNFKLIIGDMKVRALMLQTNDKGQDFLHFKSMVRKPKCPKKNYNHGIKEQLGNFKMLFWPNIKKFKSIMK
jgi:hypothetical protein